MKTNLYYILMADIMDSRKTDQQELMIRFKDVVGKVNAGTGSNLLSPLTITLGDEFQSVSGSLSLALNIIIDLEETILKHEAGFKLRYVLLQGEIETPVNSKIAHEMLGSGLTAARETLSLLKNTKNRFRINIQDQKLTEAINNTFIAFQGIIDDWNIEKDYYIVAKFLELADYKLVAVALDKERSLMWKREKSLKMAEYSALKNVIKYLGEN